MAPSSTSRCRACTRCGRSSPPCACRWRTCATSATIPTGPGVSCRAPGTHIPYVYTAGTYYQADFRPDFWTVRDPERAIVIQCRDGAAYDEIIVEVEDPAATMETIRQALGAG